MLEFILYGIGFFVITLLIQWLMSKSKRKTGKSRFTFWTGTEAIIGIAILGLLQGKIEYLAAIIGFAIADNIGSENGWH